ncbi:hypothetical protein NP493_754g01003 [Ridgeia piscesae]|uniref:Ig-like domain-containing protein n=1 Tax=Ridgeia piscesae TaxID=27915 RepID=A0AAD9KPG4_RIDPI|nr:hypothetical protein NP493_754g01003 [Ridgeia piscesae]
MGSNTLKCIQIQYSSVRPEGVSVTGLGQRVKENTEVEATCDVSRVKPAADIYWRKGPDGPLQTGTTSSGLNQDHKTFHLQSTYKVSFSRNDRNTKLYCLVTRLGNKTDVWATANQTEYEANIQDEHARIIDARSGSQALTEKAPESVTPNRTIQQGEPPTRLMPATFSSSTEPQRKFMSLLTRM